MIDDTFVDRIRPLAAALVDGDLARLHVRDADFELELRRAPALSATPARTEAALEPAPPRPLEPVVADVVGIVRFTHPPVTEGLQLDADRDLAFVETLGIRNAVRSRGPGRVAAVYVADGDPVEYGQPLFAMER